jgi:hypothetical protein
MQIGYDEHPLVRPIQRPRRIGDDFGAGERERVLLVSLRSNVRRSHCVASFTNSASASARRDSVASP